MQVLRYIAAILLGLVLSLSLFVSLANLGLNRTVLKPEFIPEQLVNADVYRFVMIDLLPSAIDDTRMVNPRDYGLRLRANTIDASGLSTQEITDSILRAVSPEDFERTVSPVALGIGEYVTWNEDRVDLSTDVGTHIKAAVAELRVLMRESGAYGRLLEWEIEPRIREITGEALAAIAHPKGWSVFLFKGSPETDDRMADAVLLAFTPDWLTGEVEEALDVLPGYFVGDSEVFEFNVRPDDREVDASLEEIKALILETDSSDLLYTGVVERPVTDSFREPAQLPLGAKLSADDVLSAMRQAAPPSWVNEQAETVVDGVSAYVVGRLDEFSIEVSLVDNRSRAADILTELAMANVGDALVNLPLCDAETDEALDLLSPGVSLPDCMVPGISVNEVLTSVKPGIADAARTLLLDHVPDSVVFTEEALRSDLMSAGGREFIASFDRLRSFYSDGWTYNQDELRDDLSNEPDILQLLDGARSYLSEGYIHTYRGGAGAERRQSGRELAGQCTGVGAIGPSVPVACLHRDSCAAGRICNCAWPQLVRKNRMGVVCDSRGIDCGLLARWACVPFGGQRSVRGGPRRGPVAGRGSLQRDWLPGLFETRRPCGRLSKRCPGVDQPAWSGFRNRSADRDGKRHHLATVLFRACHAGQAAWERAGRSRALVLSTPVSLPGPL